MRLRQLGAIHTALNWRLHWRELQQILADVTPTVLLYAGLFGESVAQLARSRNPGASLDSPGRCRHFR